MRTKRQFMGTTGILLLFSWLTINTFGQTNHHVTTNNFSFIPDTLYIYPGDTVTWTNMEGNHNVNATLETWPDNPEGFGNDVGADWTYAHVFTIPGIYDYQCDPHTGFGMYGQVRVVEDVTVTVDFSDMIPHVGQDLWISLTHKNSGEELARIHQEVLESFSIQFPWVQTLNAYRIDFFVDFNGNGSYDAPPTDHAWRLDAGMLKGDTTLEFSHNIDFTDIGWQHTLTLNFSDMTPHDGQELSLELLDKETGLELLRARSTITDNFSLSLPGIEPGASYWVNLYADLNANGTYEAPPADHAWQVSLDDVRGDTSLDFTHNMDFTDIGWKDRMKFNFRGMTPHLGQLFALYVYDRTDKTYVDTLTLDPIADSDFSLYSYALMREHDYNFDFFADLSGNEAYDAPPTDHAWRRQLNDFTGDSELTFNHSINFTDIMESPVGLHNISGETLRVFPNPARDVLRFSTATFEGDELRVEILDMRGKLLGRYEMENIGSMLSLPIGQLPEGLYFLKLSSDTSTSITTFIRRDY